ncbi:hypothetical protein V6N12_028536 [Hibiscus sabdariffa]|uniref:Uncharacterized protein n=1 Tax=Hibiscus sabdariffa TaxID=183260 RepID=A0ABR2F647_9ROSI
MENLDHPVNGRRSKLLFKENGDLALTDTAHFNVWAISTVTKSKLITYLQLAKSEIFFSEIPRVLFYGRALILQQTLFFLNNHSLDPH